MGDFLPYIHPKLDLGAIAASLVEWAVYPVAAWGEEGQVLVWNSRMQGLTGWAPSELEGRAWCDVLCSGEDERRSLKEVTRRVLEGEYPRETDVCLAISRRDGTEILVACRPFPLVSPAGEKPLGVAAVFQNLGGVSRPIATRAMDPSSGLPLDQELGTLIFRVDARSGRLIYTNSLMASFLGYESQDLLDDQRLLPSRILSEYDESFHEAMESAIRGVARSVEVGFVHADGHDIFSVVTLYPLKGAVGQVVAIEAVGRDVTGRKEAEARLAKSLEDLRGAYEALQIQHADLKSVERLKSQILANVSHELRTPLVTIRGYNDLMRQGALGDLTEGQRKGLDISARSIQRLLVLIENLLDYARIERRGLHQRRDVLDLVQLVRAAVDEIREEAMRQNIELDVSLPSEPIFVSCDGKRVKTVFFNLLDNAVKFSQAQGHVSVKCFVSGVQEACVEVHDEGIGIPPAELRRIFDGFYQVDGSTTRSYPGAGIGLAVSKEIVERHGGRIEVESTAGKGTSFQVYLPVLRDAALARHENSEGLETENEAEGDAGESRAGSNEVKTAKIRLDISKIDR